MQCGHHLLGLSRVCEWFFFFKQKTAYEMRISDWSSDVCSSDLGDSSRMVYDTSASTMATNPYFNGTSPVDPLVFPARSLALLAKFPPTLLVTAPRDFALSSTVYTHSRLVAQGVDADRKSTRLNSSH